MTRPFTSTAAGIAAGLCLAAAAHAQSGPDLLIKPFKKGTSVQSDSSALWAFNADSDNDFDLSLGYFESQSRARIFKDSAIRPVVGYRAVHLTIDTDDPILPDQLGDYSVGLGFGAISHNGWLGGFTVGMGYASTEPFGDGNAYYGKATFVVGKEKVVGGWDFGLALDYDRNRVFMPDIPLPGFVFSRRFEEANATVRLGIPVSGVIWQPNEEFEAQFDFIFPTFVNAKATYYPARQLGMYAEFASRGEAFFSDRFADSDDRLMFWQRRAELGVVWRPKDGFEVNLAGGYAFGQEFKSGFDVRHDDDVAELDDAPYARLALRFDF
jgi:hypothetical protein